MLLGHLSRLHSTDDGQQPQAGASPVAEGDPATPQAGTTTTDAAPAAAEAPTLTPAEARALKNEAQNLRRRLKEFEEAKAEAERASLSEAERTKADLTAAQQRALALEAENAELRLEKAIRGLTEPATIGEGDAAKDNPLRGINPGLILRVIDRDAIQRDEAGSPTNLRKLAETAAREFGIAPPPVSGDPAPRPAHAPQRAAAQGQVGKPDLVKSQTKKYYPPPTKPAA